MKATRRGFLAGLSALLPAGWLAPQVLAANASANRQLPDYFGELGVRPFINAVGPYSSLGGAQMWPEVIEAMDYAIKNKARMTDLHDAVGQRIAELTGAESAMVTAGATSAIIVGTAACMTLGDKDKMERLPDASSMRNEVIIQRGQRYMYDRSIRTPGATLVEVETAEDITAAIGPDTAMLFYLLNRPEEASVPMEEYIALGKAHDIPVSAMRRPRFHRPGEFTGPSMPASISSAIPAARACVVRTAQGYYWVAKTWLALPGNTVLPTTVHSAAA